MLACILTLTHRRTSLLAQKSNHTAQHAILHAIECVFFLHADVLHNVMNVPPQNFKFIANAFRSLLVTCVRAVCAALARQPACAFVVTCQCDVGGHYPSYRNSCAVSARCICCHSVAFNGAVVSNRRVRARLRSGRFYSFRPAVRRKMQLLRLLRRGIQRATHGLLRHSIFSSPADKL